MQWSRSLLVTVFIGLATAAGAWRENQEFNYKVYTRTLTASKDDTWDGVVFQTRLTLRPLSDEHLMGKLSRPQYAKVKTSTRRADADIKDMHFNDLPMEEPFHMVLRNGIVKALLVSRRLSEDEVYQLKFVVKAVMNQLKVDGNAHYQMDGDNGAYNTNEETMMGNCETIYEISPLPQYLAQSSRDLVPLPRLQTQGRFIDVVKSRDYSRCNQRSNTGPSSNSNEVPTLTEVTRIILSGSLNDYTVQSSFSTLKSADSLNAPPNTISYVNITLESIDSDVRYVPMEVDTLMDVENNYPPLVRASRKNVKTARMMGASVREHNDYGEIKVSKCWSWFPSVDGMCYSDFGAEWVGVAGVEICGVLGFGKKTKCQRKYPGCGATVCHPFFTQDLCKDFNGRLPVERGVVDNCAPGFRRWRCCPY